jgi:hypothetical protein
MNVEQGHSNAKTTLKPDSTDVKIRRYFPDIPVDFFPFREPDSHPPV